MAQKIIQVIPAPKKKDGSYEFEFADNNEPVRFFGLTEEGSLIPYAMGGETFGLEPVGDYDEEYKQWHCKVFFDV